MREVDAAVQALRVSRAPMGTRQLVWIEARNRATGAVEGLGLWTGEEDEEITVQDRWTGATVTRLFRGAGGLLGVEGIEQRAGFAVRPVTLRLSVIDPTVIAAVRLYDPRNARTQIWRRTYAGETGLAVGHPEARFKGFVDKAPIPRPAPGGEAVIEARLVSAARLLTLPAPRRKSDAAQRRRDPADAFRTDKATMGSADIPWGQPDGRE